LSDRLIVYSISNAASPLLDKDEITIFSTIMERAMITEEDLAQQFTFIIEQAHPTAWKILRHCYVKVLTSRSKGAYIANTKYIRIYCPDRLIVDVVAEKNLLIEVAEYLGLVEVACLNATNLLHDPKLQLKNAHPKLWLDLMWIVTQDKQL
jgi:hypothetical protein